jgi:hypothetical protein
MSHLPPAQSPRAAGNDGYPSRQAIHAILLYVWLSCALVKTSHAYGAIVGKLRGIFKRFHRLFQDGWPSTNTAADEGRGEFCSMHAPSAVLGSLYGCPLEGYLEAGYNGTSYRPYMRSAA